MRMVARLCQLDQQRLIMQRNKLRMTLTKPNIKTTQRNTRIVCRTQTCILRHSFNRLLLILIYIKNKLAIALCRSLARQRMKIMLKS